MKSVQNYSTENAISDMISDIIPDCIHKFTSEFTDRIRHVIDNHSSCCPSIVHGSQAMISLLPCSVPNLKLDCLIIYSYRLREECCAYG